MIKNSIVWLVATLLLAGSVQTCFGQEQRTGNTLTAAKDSKPAAAKIEQLAWIAGHWQGDAMGGSFEESWAPAKGGAMMGMFKMVMGDEIRFYEMLTIVPVEDSLILRLKHFSSELHGWEEKDKTVDFPLVKMTETEAFFDGLTFRRINADEMHIFVVIGKDEPAQEILFACRRAGSAAKGSPSTSDEHARYRAAIENVLEIDRVLSTQRDQMTFHESLENSVTAYVLGLETIDDSKCPRDFAQALEGHRRAWKNSIEFLRQHESLRGEMHDLFDQIREMDKSVADELDRHFNEIMESWNAVDSAVAKYQ
jgi:hypothetical protein